MTRFPLATTVVSAALMAVLAAPARAAEPVPTPACTAGGQSLGAERCLGIDNPEAALRTGKVPAGGASAVAEPNPLVLALAGLGGLVFTAARRSRREG